MSASIAILVGLFGLLLWWGAAGRAPKVSEAGKILFAAGALVALLHAPDGPVHLP